MCDEPVARQGLSLRSQRHSPDFIKHRLKTSASRPVSRVLCRARERATVIYLAGRLPGRSSSLPGSRNGPDQPCSLIWPCSRWGLPSQPVARLLVGSYIKGPKSSHLFTLTSEGSVSVAGVSDGRWMRTLSRTPSDSDGGILSVALSLSFAAGSRASRLGRWALPTTASCGARTFLSPVWPAEVP